MSPVREGRRSARAVTAGVIVVAAWAGGSIVHELTDVQPLLTPAVAAVTPGTTGVTGSQHDLPISATSSAPRCGSTDQDSQLVDVGAALAPAGDVGASIGSDGAADSGETDDDGSALTAMADSAAQGSSFVPPAAPTTGCP